MEKYYDYAIRFELVMEELRSKCDVEAVVDKLCDLRSYSDIRMKQSLLEIGMFQVEYFDIKEYSSSMATFKEFGLLDKNGNFILERGYIVPIRDIEGYLIALVAWFPGRPTSSKYITASGKYFKKAISLFNIDNAVKLGNFNLLFVVEGIFDCIAMRSIGLPCVSIQGSIMSDIKRTIIKMFKKIVTIPDNDSVGSEALLNWKIEGKNTYLEIEGNISIDGKNYPVKDCDDLIKYYEDMYDVFIEVSKSNNKREKIAV